jgi:hypothetical protein
MNITLKALLLIPLALLASCATGPKLTPEMETLRLSLNQRMANTSTTEKEAYLVQGSGGINHELRTTNTMIQTQILRNCDLLIKTNESLTQEIKIPRTTLIKKLNTVYKLPAKSLTIAYAKFDDWDSKHANDHDGYSGDSTYNALKRSRVSHFACELNAYGSGGKFPTFQCVNYHEDQPILKKLDESTRKTLQFDPSELVLWMDLARSPDKAFIQGIVRDMNRFIELYKALPK